MARNVALLPVTPERIWAVLSDPAGYGYWVVGPDTIRDADGGWPQPGTKIHHRVGAGPLKLNDDTQVVEADAQRRLVLHARARPFGTARVELQLVPEGTSTRVVMIEGPGDRLSRLLHNPLTDRVMHRRNEVALRRLTELSTG
ncbi:MAG: SRPBCC family protein [Actinomycetota bacterium]|nr:SRPBCC family protein [Actinomycetota bacterium]